MIYFVDEDDSQTRPFRVELEFRGYKVELIQDADLALGKLSNTKPDQTELVLIDVMLSANPDEKMSKFKRSETSDFTLTGIAMLEELISMNVEVFPRKAVLFSMASTDRILSKITSASEKHSIPFLLKSKFPTAYEFGEEIQRILNQLGDAR